MSAQLVERVPKDTDEELLRCCQEWHVIRGELECCDPDTRFEKCARMEELLGRLSHLTPVSFEGLRDVLAVAAQVLAAQAIDPDSYLASIDVFGLVTRARKAVDYSRGEIGGAS